MTVEKALETAIHFETRVHQLYSQAAEQETDQAAKRTLEVLAREESYHLDYLKKRREEWLATGRISAEQLKSELPSPQVIANAAKRLKEHLKGHVQKPQERHLEVLKRAQKVEQETSDFYRSLVSQIEGEAKEMFARFLEIEDGHLALVSAELDSVQGLGFWFDVKEFDLEAG